MIYADEFYVEESHYATLAARVVLPTVLLTGETVIDIGCGTGAWAYTAQQAGHEVLGVDFGVPPMLLLPIPYEDCDLTHVGYRCDNFDLAICLEVAEHLDDQTAQPLVNGLARAGRVLFSAATPGQMGVNHVNCQPHDYWHELFAPHGLTPTHIGPSFGEPVADYYQRNMFVYA